MTPVKNLDSKRIEWYTPSEVVDYFGVFDYDPATTTKQAEYLKIPYYDTKETDGLLSDWTKYERIWINPPFNKKADFLKKAIETYLEAHNDIYFLCPTEFLTTKTFCSLMDNICFTLYIPRGRIKFLTDLGVKKSPAFGTVILKFAPNNGIKIINI